MNKIFQDESKIKAFIGIQHALLNLEPGSSEEAIDKLIKKIPRNFLEQKEDLMVICQLFAHYSFSKFHKIKRNDIKLIEKIMDPIKRLLKDESLFFYKIFEHSLYFRYLFYREGIISMQTIINDIRSTKSAKIAECFLPEIIAKEPYIFSKEIAAMLKVPLTTKYINDFKIIRQKYFDWIQHSSDYRDPLYKEIEKNPLLYSIKTDNVVEFQSFLSKTNTKINSIIEDSLFECNNKSIQKMSLLSFSIKYNATNIFKFLIMNNVEISIQDVPIVLQNGNYEMIHIIENKIPEKFKQESFYASITNWNEEMVDYVLENYPPNFLKETDNDKYDEMNEKLLIIALIYTFNSCNFMFFESFLLPFLRSHPNFVKNHIYKIINYSFVDKSCFFFSELIKYDGIELNHFSAETKNTTILIQAVQYKNERAIEMLLKNPKVDINDMGGISIYPFLVACTLNCDLKVIKLFCDHPKFNVNMKCNKQNTFHILLTQGCSFALDYLIQNYPNMEKAPFAPYCYTCIKINRLVNLKIFIKYQLTIESKEAVTKSLRAAASFGGGFNENYYKTFLSIVDELTK